MYSQNHNSFIEGYWFGVLEFQGSELILTFAIRKNNKDSLMGEMKSPLQSSKEIALSKIKINNDSVYLQIKSIGASYRGVFDVKDTLINGLFSQASYKIPLKLKRTLVPFILKRPQEPKPPFNYESEEVSFDNTKEGIKLSGTLTYPKGEGKYPAVVLITGSGPQDRDEEILGHKPFWIIADYLSRNGIAVLRYDDRGVGKSGGNFATSTSMDFATDAEAAITFLRKHSKISPNQIGLLGHSEGGMIASIIASKDKNIKFIVLLAGPGLSGENILLTQIKKMLDLDENNAEFIRRVMDDSKKTYHLLKKNPNPPKAAKAIRKYYKKRAEQVPANEQLEYGYTGSGIEIKIEALNSPWFRYFLTFNPEDYLRKVDCPVFALFGDKDVQVVSKENSSAIEHIAKRYKKDNFTIKIYPGKNHLFQNAQKGSLSEYAKIEETISPEVLKDILVWMKDKIEKSK